MVSITTVPGGNYKINLSDPDEVRLKFAWKTFQGDPVYDKKTFQFKMKNDPFPVKLRVCDIKNIEFIAE